LISNAIRYGNQEAVRVAVQQVGDQIRVSVSNQGPALEAAELDAIFAPLFRGSAGTSNTDREHLGLGLFIVRQTAEAHGGTVHAQSSGGNTDFAMVLRGGASTGHRAPT
jgi:signal transduction histidine kinase